MYDDDDGMIDDLARPNFLNESTWLPPAVYHAKKEAAKKSAIATCRQVANAMVTCGHKVSHAQKMLETTTNRKWSSLRVRKWTKKKDCQKEIWRLEQQDASLNLHNRNEIMRRVTESLHADRTQIFDVKPPWIEEVETKGGKIHKIQRPARFVMKPFEEWPDALRWAFDGFDWKTPKGQDPIPVAKFLSKDSMIEKAGKELGLWKDKVEHTGKDGRDLVIQILKFAEKVEEKE
jgi:hypothetical protein